jgi:hypothetical protein
MVIEIRVMLLRMTYALRVVDEVLEVAADERLHPVRIRIVS